MNKNNDTSLVKARNRKQKKNMGTSLLNLHQPMALQTQKPKFGHVLHQTFIQSENNRFLLLAPPSLFPPLECPSWQL